VVDQLAYHSLQAKDVARAAGYARRAGDKALQMRAYREALADYETGLELLETDDPRERAALTEQLAAAAAPLDADLNLRYLREAHQIYAQIGDRQKVAEIDRWIGQAAQVVGDWEAAFAHAHAAVAAFEAEPPGRDLATAYFIMSRLYMLTARPHESIAWAEKAQPLAEACADEELAANLLNNIGMSLVLLGETQRGLALLERALDLTKRLAASTWFTCMPMSSNLSFCLTWLGEFARAAAIAREGCEHAAEAGYNPGTERFVLSIAELYLGHWDAADALFDRMRRYGEPWPWEAELLRRRGRLEAARQMLEQSLPAINTLRIGYARGALRCALARTHLALGASEQAAAVMDGGIADWRTTGPLLGTEPLLGCGVEVYLAAGRAEHVCELLDALSTIAERAASLMSLACCDDAHGLFAAHSGRPAAAAEHFRQAAARWQAMAAPFEEAVARRRLAESLLLTSDPAARSEAQRELAAAREAFARLGAPLELAAAEALVEQHGLAPDPAPQGSVRVFLDAAVRQSSSLVEPLSERELEVLALIAQGHSNQQIADVLIVSVGTIKKHLNNIFGKLGVHSRTQAVARARELSLL
jgi:ATP/maltotriose-dependent transcriptional regulator MalT